MSKPAKPKTEPKPKEVEFRGTALDDLKDFPTAARKEAGHQIDQVQNGRDPDDWKPMGTVGAGVREIRVHEGKDQYRALYVTKLGDKVYVLHCFHKTTKQTSQSDIDVAAKRYRELVKELKK